MLVHDEFMAHDASPQPFNETRPKSGVLTPASETSSLHDSQTLSRKRKRDNTENGNGLEDLLSERFTVKVGCISSQSSYHVADPPYSHTHLLSMTSLVP